MPDYPIVAGHTSAAIINSADTRYVPPMGYLYTAGTEISAQFIARDNYTLKNLYLRITANTLNGATTVRSRINGANGNQSVSIDAAATGVFEDAVNTDAVNTGSLFNSSWVSGGDAGNIRMTVCSFVLSTASNTTPILGVIESLYIDVTLTRYTTIVGNMSGPGAVTESLTYYLFRAAATLSNFRCYVTSNGISGGASTARTRINGANGNQSVSIPASTAGAFEDAANTDVIAIGNNVNYQIVGGPSGNGPETMYIVLFQIKSNSVGKQVAAGNPSPTGIAGSNTLYAVIESDSAIWTGAEADTQATTRAPFTAKNMYVNIGPNTLAAIATFRLRKNGGDTTLVVSVGATATGQFEDVAHTDSFIATDLFNWEIVTAVGAGAINILCIGFELEQAPPVGLENKAANMGSKMVGAGLI